jgi:hypothetical protein
MSGDMFSSMVETERQDDTPGEKLDFKQLFFNWWKDKQRSCPATFQNTVGGTKFCRISAQQCLPEQCFIIFMLNSQYPSVSRSEQ